MSGAGTFPAGTEPAGHDPVTDVSAGVRPVARRARFFEVETRTFPIGTDGRPAYQHPVDQAVSFALGIAKGTIPSAPELGLDVERLSSASRSRALNTATDIVSRALDPWVQAGDVRFVSVTLNGDVVLGRVPFEVTYVNLRTPNVDNRPRTVRI